MVLLQELLQDFLQILSTIQFCEACREPQFVRLGGNHHDYNGFTPFYDTFNLYYPSYLTNQDCISELYDSIWLLYFALPIIRHIVHIIQQKFQSTWIMWIDIDNIEKYSNHCDVPNSIYIYYTHPKYSPIIRHMLHISNYPRCICTNYPITYKVVHVPMETANGVRKCFKYPCCTVCNMENGSKKNHVVIDIH
jgi:hypothetical protein